MSQNSRLFLINDVHFLRLHLSTQYCTCWFKMMLQNKQFRSLRTLFTSWSKRLNCQSSSEFKQWRSMFIFTIIQQSDSSLMIKQQLLRRHSLRQNYSLITFMCENVNATSLLIQSPYLSEIDKTSLWIMKEWECSWTTLMKSWSSINYEHQISSTSLEVMLSSLLRMKREKVSTWDFKDRHQTLSLSKSWLNDHERRISQLCQNILFHNYFSCLTWIIHLCSQKYQLHWKRLNSQIQTHEFEMYLQNAAKRSVHQRQLSFVNLSTANSKWSSSFYELKFSRDNERTMTSIWTNLQQRC